MRNLRPTIQRTHAKGLASKTLAVAILPLALSACSDSGSEGEDSRPTVTLTTTKPAKAKKGDERREGSEPSKDPKRQATAGECPYPVIENPKGSGSAKPGEEIALFCDGEWLHAAKYQTDFLWIEHYDGSRWQKVDYDGRNPGGLQSPCYSEAKLRKKGAPQELIDEIILCQ